MTYLPYTVVADVLAVRTRADVERLVSPCCGARGVLRFVVDNDSRVVCFACSMRTKPQNQESDEASDA